MTSGPAQPKLLDRVREAIRVRHYSRRTEEAYAHWIRRGPERLPVVLLYGGGLRLEECPALRVKDIDLKRRKVVVRRGKGQKDRVHGHDVRISRGCSPVRERHRVLGAHFHAQIADRLSFAGQPDIMGAGMAIVLDAVLGKGFTPDGFEQRDGYGVYRYMKAE